MRKDDMLFAIYNQLGRHMWMQRRPTDMRGRYVSDRVDDFEPNWRKRMEYASKCGANAVVVDVAEMLQYPSHPEIWIDGAWSAEKMNGWVKWLKSLGFRDVIPSLNFSTDHDLWLGQYSRMISTPQYYGVCADLIRDTYEIFDRPRLFNYGMDEESLHNLTTSPNHRNGIIVLRQGDLYWHDNLFFVKEIESLGARAWTWSDKIWWSREDYLKNMPKSVLQSNWFYGPTFTEGGKGWKKYHKMEVEAYEVLEKAGYDQVPGCSNCCDDTENGFSRKNSPNIRLTFDYCRTHIAPERLLGFHAMSWSGVTPSGDSDFFTVCDMFRDAIASFSPLQV